MQEVWFVGDIEGPPKCFAKINAVSVEGTGVYEQVGVPKVIVQLRYYGWVFGWRDPKMSRYFLSLE